MNVRNCLDPKTLQGLLEQSLPARQSLVCEEHIESCDRCRQALELLAGETHWWQEAAELLSTELEISRLASMPADQAAIPFAMFANSKPNQAIPVQPTDSDRDAKTLALQRVRQLLTPGHPELLGRLANYDIESFIGQGGFGVVLRAFDRELNRTVAIKVLAPHLATVGAARRRFVREAQAAAAVVHPNVVPIHAVQADAEHPYLVMTFVPGCSLQEYIRRHGPVEPQAVVRIAQQVAAGLAAAHRQGLVHRDIKPGNILLENGLSRALITDFGLARAADDAATQTGWLAGTPHYMSPEQAASENLDGRSDLFSLGSVMYFMATGREPFRGTQPLAILNQIAHQRLSSIRNLNPEVPRTLARIIERLLEKNPQDRFQSADQLSDLLEQYLAHLQQPDVRAKPRLPQNRRRQLGARSRWLAAATLLLTMAASYYGWQIDRKPTGNQFLASEFDDPEKIGTEDQSAVQKITAEQTIERLEPGISSPEISLVNRNRIAGVPPHTPDIDDPLMQLGIEWQRSQATWMVEGVAVSQEIVSLNEAIDRIEQLSSQPSSLLPETSTQGLNELQHWQRSILELDRLLEELEVLLQFPNVLN